MNIINALTLRHLKLNKKRTIVTIIGVIISVAMITAVATFVTSFLSMMQRVVIGDTGNWHVLYKDVAIQKADAVISDKNTATAALGKDIGYALLDGSKNEDKPYLFIKAFNPQGFKNFNLNLIEGRFPKNANEIVISSQIIENAGVVYKVGDVLKLNVGGRYLDGQENSLGQDAGFVDSNTEHRGERLIAKSAKEYTITGIISRPGFEPYWAPGYTVIAYLDQNELASAGAVDIAVALKSVPGSLYQKSDELAKNAGISNEGIIYNRELLRYHGVISDDNLLSTLYNLAAVVLVLIMVGSVSLIYNAFAISISERSRHLGMLASIGATKKQKRNSVFFEGLVVGVIGIPAGIITGTLGMGLTFILVQPLLGAISGTQKLTLVTPPAAILLAVLLSIIIIFISAYIPASRASKISPIDAIRQARDIKLTGGAVKTSKLTRLIFGFEAELALKNLKRNRRRYLATIFSLVLSIVLFLSVSSLSLLTQKSAELAKRNIPYDVQVFVASSATAQEKKDFYHAITGMEYADVSVIEQTMQAVLNADGQLLPDKVKSAIEPNYKELNIKTYDIAFDITAIDEAALTRYAKELGIDVVLLKDTVNPKGILVNTVDVNMDHKYRRLNQFNIKAGDKLKLTHRTDNEPDALNNIFEVAALADKTPIGETALRNPSQAMFIVSEEVFAAMEAGLPEKYAGTNMVDMLIKSSNPARLVENINEYQRHTSIANVNIFDVAKADQDSKRFFIFIGIFFYGFVALITAICVANIFNTVSTSIALRKREFGMLKSIGMTPEGFNKMINYESLFYGLKALLYGLPVSFVMMYLMHNVLGNSFESAFTVPWASVLAAIVVVFLIVGSTMLYASSKIKHENIIDVLKEENI